LEDYFSHQCLIVFVLMVSYTLNLFISGKLKRMFNATLYIIKFYSFHIYIIKCLISMICGFQLSSLSSLHLWFSTLLQSVLLPLIWKALNMYLISMTCGFQLSSLSSLILWFSTLYQSVHCFIDYYYVYLISMICGFQLSSLSSLLLWFSTLQ